MAENLRDHLLDIRAKYGELTPRVIVDEARDPASPLHKEFEWDDAAAADRFRLIQAGQLVVRCRLTFTRADGSSGSIQQFYSIDRKNAPVMYEPVDEIAADPLRQKMLLRQAQHEWSQLKARYEHLGEFFAMIREDLGKSA